MVYIQINQDYRRYGKGILFSDGSALNETATYIFDLCDGFNTVERIINHIQETYDCDYSDALTDVNSCLADLVERKIIKVKE